MAETCMLVKYHICYQQFCSIVTRKVFCVLLHQKEQKNELSVSEDPARKTPRKAPSGGSNQKTQKNKCLRLKACEVLVIRYMQITKVQNATR